MTPEQYLETERAAEFRSEYLDGEMFAMSGATPRHNIVVNNLGAALRAQLKGRCRYFTTDLRLLREFFSPADVVRIASIDAEVSLAAIYEDIEFNA